jgi:myogenesis-regulating glycosidase
MNIIKDFITITLFINIILLCNNGYSASPDKIKIDSFSNDNKKIINIKINDKNDFKLTHSWLNGGNSLLFNLTFNENDHHIIDETKKVELIVKTITSGDSNVNCLNITSTGKDQEVCFDLSDASWFGGHESQQQPYWPINSQIFSYIPYATGFADSWGAVLERYWLSSKGIAIFVDEDVPLMVQHLNLFDKNTICFKSSVLVEPFKYTPVYKPDTLSYQMCWADDIKTVHNSMIKRVFGLPQSRPSVNVILFPIWTTWNYYFKEINQTTVIDFLDKILSYGGYYVAQLEIDDRWESHYGDLEFDKIKFPDPAAMV